MRFLLINDSASPHTGGKNRMVVETCELLADAGHQVALAYHDESPVSVGCPVYRVREALPLEARCRDLLRAVDDFRPDLLYNHSTKVSPALAELSGRVPVTTFLHDQSAFCSGGDRTLRGYRPCHRPHSAACLLWHYLDGCGGRHPANNWRVWRDIRQRLWPALLPRARVQVGSEFMRRGLRENEVPDERIDLVPLFAVPPATPAGTQVPGLLLLPSRLVPSKGVQVALAGLARHSSLPWRLVIPGDGPQRGELEELTRWLGLGERVEFTGEISPEALAGWYERAEVVLFPVLRGEPFGLVGVEALAHGRPIVAFAGGAVEEWLWPGETGLRVDEKTPAAFGAAIAELLGDPTRCRAMSAAARQRYGQFGPEAFLKRLESAFARTVAWFHESAPGGPA